MLYVVVRRFAAVVSLCVCSQVTYTPWCGATRFLARDTPVAATSPCTLPCHKHYVALPRRVTPASMYFAPHQRFAHTRTYCSEH